ncbi:glycosyltransferase [Simkania negevensis]|uniref:Glycosyltransferase 2-like domain-containing protein n=1 Tax=Simkania negevensis (strain ATCC VR-1471 / DSM 27360 / Z) TaxID=331113 RepID=F8L5B0_SIMNZ|nr:glycosyltransferase [Simkania negevensis]CCB87996.1 hypothetical protein SNE_A01180 [Simkania negevensis Z]
MEYSTSNPKVSVLLATRNGLPFLRQNIESLKSQTFKDFELIIQDGDSTDGSVEYLSSIKDTLRFPYSFESAPDNGIRQAYGRALQRSQGNILYFTASDERLPSDGLERAVFHFDQNPRVKIVYGSVKTVDEKGGEIDRYVPPLFDFHRFLRFESSFPMACTFLKSQVVKQVAQDMSFNEPTLAWDYDLWIRLGEILKDEEIFYRPNECFAEILATPVSRSFQGKIWEQFPQDACFMFDRFICSSLERQKLLSYPQAYYQSLYVGIALRKILELEGVTPRAREIYAKLRGLNFSGHLVPYNAEISCDFNPQNCTIFPGTKQLHYLGLWKVVSEFSNLLERFSLRWLNESSHFRFYPRWRNRKKSLNQMFILAGRIFSIFTVVFKKKRLLFRSGEFLWGYSVQFDIENCIDKTPHKKRWLKIDLKVFSGAIGICLMKKDAKGELAIREEQTFIPGQKVTTYFHLPNEDSVTLIFRNNLTTHCLYEIHRITIVESR